MSEKPAERITCAVRTIKKGFGNDSARTVLLEAPLPHEPIMYDAESFLIPINPAMLSNFVVKVCKHCGAVYGERL